MVNNVFDNFTPQELEAIQEIFLHAGAAMDGKEVGDSNVKASDIPLSMKQMQVDNYVTKSGEILSSVELLPREIAVKVPAGYIDIVPISTARSGISYTLRAFYNPESGDLFLAKVDAESKMQPVGKRHCNLQEFTAKLNEFKKIEEAKALEKPVPPADIVQKLQKSLEGDNVEFEGITHNKNGASYNYRVDGVATSFTTKDNEVFKIWADFGKGAKVTHEKVHIEELEEPIPPADVVQKLHNSLGRDNVEFEGITHNRNGASYNYRVDGVAASFTTKDNEVFKIWADFGKGAKVTHEKVHIEELGDYEIDIHVLNPDRERVLTKLGEEPELLDQPKPRARANRSSSDGTSGTVLNPTPLQTMVIWTELETKYNNRFAKDPYSIKEFSAYRCQAGVLTCGFGSTGKEFRWKMTVDEAFDFMNTHIDYQVGKLRKQIGNDYFDKLTANEQDAISSLGYNAGSIGDGLIGRIREYADNPTRSNCEAVCDKLEQYNKVRNPRTKKLEVSNGLVNRREIEVAVFRGDIHELSDQDLMWLVPAAALDKTRQQFKEYIEENGRWGDKNSLANLDKENLGKDLASNGVKENHGENAQLPQEVLDNALAQAQLQAQAQANSLS